jgi:hypothetical protein
MNTGIGDAVNLAWKLAAVLQGRALPLVLDSYDAERIRFARTLVATTDRGFQVVSSRGPIARRVRTQLLPLLLPLLFRFARVRRLLFRTISQTAIQYRASALSTGAAGGVAGGDRLPWVPLEGASGAAADNFASLASRDWQAHVYGDVAPAVQTLCAERGLALHVFPWRAAMRRAGLRRNALYLIRPDGYVGLADEAGSPRAIAQYLDAHGVRASGGGAAG